MAPDLLVLFGLQAGLFELLRLGRAALEEPDGREDEQEELEPFRLPVLEDGSTELR